VSAASHRLLAVTSAVDPRLATLQAVRGRSAGPGFFWEEPDAEFLLAGFGRAWEHVSSPGPDRIAGAGDAAADLFSRLESVGDGVGGPKLMGGFAFSGLPEPDQPPGVNGWDRFPPGSLVLPDLTITRSGDRASMTAVVPAEAGAEEVARAAIDRAVHRLRTDRDSGPVGRADGPRPADPNGEDAYRSLVKLAVAEVESGRLAKVVAARSALLHGAGDPWQIISALGRRYPSCATFGIFRAGSVFLGATPELLVALRRGRVTSRALAGTVVRGGDALADARLEDRLRHDPKELAEHQYVVQGLRRELHDAGVDLDPPEPHVIVKLANVQHLGSPVSGRVASNISVLDLVAAVHPTPAVAGLPRTAALEWLADNEGLDRGWYAGPVGFVDSSLEGVFRVALRCALVDGERARLFAGAGIVAGSRPERELSETTAKLRAMLDALR
jgi:isochorismate synthase